MNTMYKEVIERRKTPVVVGSFIFITLMIAISNGVENIRIFDYRIGNMMDPILMIITLGLILVELLKCRVRYKYSIIADQLIIHKLYNDEQNIIENIKLQDIVFVGKMKELNKKVQVLSSKNCICSLIHLNHVCCIYKDGQNFKKLYIQPSSKLLEKLKRVSKNNQANA